MDRLHIEITGALPDKGKHAIMAAAEVAAEEMSQALSEKHGIGLTVSVRAIRPGKNKPIVQAETLAPEPVGDVPTIPLRPRRTAAE